MFQRKFLRKRCFGKVKEAMVQTNKKKIYITELNRNLKHATEISLPSIEISYLHVTNILILLRNDTAWTDQRICNHMIVISILYAHKWVNKETRKQSASL